MRKSALPQPGAHPLRLIPSQLFRIKERILQILQDDLVKGECCSILLEDKILNGQLGDVPILPQGGVRDVGHLLERLST